MRYVTLLIKPASSICNMHCKYCFYHDVAGQREVMNKGIMKQDVMETLILKAFNSFSEDSMITFAFQGGEPTCAGLSFFKHFVSFCKEHQGKHQVAYTLQTNGYLIDDEWAKFFAENHFMIGLSLDGFRENHNDLRLCNDNSDSYSRCMKALKCMRRHQVIHNILIVLTSQLSKYPEKLYEFIKKQKMEYVQLIPCMPDIHFEEEDYALKPKEFFEFYDVFFNLWFEDYLKGNEFSVTLFDNLIPLFVGIPPQQCGYLGNCSRQMVIEGNGDIYPCDFYAMDEYITGNVMKDDFRSLAASSVYTKFLNEPKRKCNLCEKCRYVQICHGQCKRLNVCYYDEDYCGYQEFIRKNERKLMYVANQIKRGA